MYVLDIETRGDKRLLETYLDNIQAPKNIKDPDKIEAYIVKAKEEANKGMATDADYCEIICIGVKEAGKPGVQMNIQEFATWLASDYDAGHGATGKNIFRKMITFNGKQFDIPVIIRAGIKAGIQMPYQLLVNMCDKYKAKNHIDLMQELSVGYGNYKSLDKYAQIYLEAKKESIDFNTASEEEIRKHNLEDLELTAKLFNKFRPLFIWEGIKLPDDIKLEDNKITTM